MPDIVQDNTKYRDKQEKENKLASINTKVIKKNLENPSINDGGQKIKLD